MDELATKLKYKLHKDDTTFETDSTTSFVPTGQTFVSVAPNFESSEFEFPDVLRVLTNHQELRLVHRGVYALDVKDANETLLFKGSMDTMTKYWIVTVPKGPGVTFRLSTNEHSDFVVARGKTGYNGCFPQSTDMEVKSPPDIPLGIIHGQYDELTLSNTSEDVLCTMKIDTGKKCCQCDRPPYLIVPASTPEDIGRLEYKNRMYNLAFPRVADARTRALIVCSVLSINYQAVQEGY